jgi:molybdopterin/thiamine biosynthesis adenylyltransferase
MLSYKSNFIPSTFFLVGAGGTGSRFLPLLAQFLKTTPWLQSPNVIVIDHDVVEEKNLVRQNFIKPDIGRPKAVVLAERYGRAYDLNIKPMVQKMHPTNSDSRIFDLGPGNIIESHRIMNAVVIMAVDSAAARRDILKSFCNNRATGRGSHNVLFIDAGNGDDFGQVQIFNPVTFAGIQDETKFLENVTISGGMFPVDFELPYIPMPVDFYSGMVDAAEKSCADLDQSLAINAMMATTIMGMLQTFIYNKRLNAHRINVTLTNGANPEYLTVQHILKFYNWNRAKTNMVNTSGIIPTMFDITNSFSQMEELVMRFKREKGLFTPQEKAREEKVEMSSLEKLKEMAKILKSKEIDAIRAHQQQVVSSVAEPADPIGQDRWIIEAENPLRNR